MTNRDEILAATFVVVAKEHSPNGARFVASITNGEMSRVPVVCDGSVDPKFFHLVSASRVMFGALDEQGTHLQKVLDIITEAGMGPDAYIYRILNDMQVALMTAQQCAIDGLASVADRINRTGGL